MASIVAVQRKYEYSVKIGVSGKCFRLTTLIAFDARVGCYFESSYLMGELKQQTVSQVQYASCASCKSSNNVGGLTKGGRLHLKHL